MASSYDVPAPGYPLPAALAIEPDPGDRKTLEGIFCEAGWRLQVVEDADQAIALRLPDPVTLILIPVAVFDYVECILSAIHPMAKMVAVVRFGNLSESLNSLEGRPFDVLVKPYAAGEIRQVATFALSMQPQVAAMTARSI